MRAVVIHEHGGPENLVFEANYPEPTAGPGEVIVKVKACSLNYHDIFTRRGMPGIKLPLPVIPGLDLAGEIAEIGAGVEGWSVGDRVLVDPRIREGGKGGLQGETIDGGLAEYAKTNAHQLVKMPDGVSFAQAASLPVAYGTSHRMMFANGNVKAGEKCLILGASGGVGTGALLLAKKAGMEVIAAGSSEKKLARLKEIGADHVIDYTKEEFHKKIYEMYGKPHRRGYEGGVDVVVNFTGGDTYVPSLRSLKRGGRLLTCGATAGYDPKTDLRFIWTFELKILGSNSWEPEDLTAMLHDIQAGVWAPVIDREFKLEDAAEALALIENRGVIGKVIVAP